MHELLDHYFLEGVPEKGELVTAILSGDQAPDAVRPYLEGLKMLRARTPDLALVALRLTLAGKSADDASVTRLRTLAERARGTGEDADRAREAYRAEVAG
jgi:hypothetical protein